jgi:hypothetical protein
MTTQLTRVGLDNQGGRNDATGKKGCGTGSENRRVAAGNPKFGVQKRERSPNAGDGESRSASITRQTDAGRSETALGVKALLLC